MLIPPGVDSGQRRHTSFVLPLTNDKEVLGAAVIEFAPGTAVYETLRDIISAGLRNSALHEEIAAKTTLHERSVQERIAATKRMNALSLLAGGVAHDLNNALGLLVILPDVILDELSENHGRQAADEEIRIDLSTIKAAALRAAQTIKDLLTLGREGRGQKESTDLNQIVRSCLSARPLGLTSHTAEITIDHFAEPLAIAASESQVVRALTNLVRNAVEAMNGVGTVIVRTSREHVEERHTSYEQIDPGEYATVSVTDHGCGIAEHERERIFEPFFSTKRQNAHSGSGLGLAIVYGVVKDSGAGPIAGAMVRVALAEGFRGHAQSVLTRFEG